MISTRTRRLAVVAPICTALLLLSSTFACGGGSGESTEPPGGGASLRVIAGADQTDTILSRLPQALIVEVRDAAGRLAPGRTVRFESVLSTTPGSRAAMVQVAPLAGLSFSFAMADVTDAQGRAKALVQLENVSGTARLVVSVPELGLMTTLSYVVKPGAAALLRLSPRDTVIPPGEAYTLTALVTDRHDNAIPNAALTYAASGVTVSATGRVTASTPGRSAIVATSSGVTDSVHVTVFPRWPLVVKDYDTIVRMNTDRTGYAPVTQPVSSTQAPHAVAATPSAVFQRADASLGAKVWVVAPGAAPRRLTTALSTVDETWPRLSADGLWVYFVRGGATLWRARLDGTSIDSLTTFASPGQYAAPSVSPDGRLVAIEDASGVKLFDVSIRTSRIVSTMCGAPRFSPDGEFFACMKSRTLSVVRTDGTGGRVIATFAGRTDSLEESTGPDWSPDGKWLLAYVADRGLTLFEVATGAQIPLTDRDEGISQASFVR